MIRLAHVFGSPNTLATGHVCQWHRDTGSKYTYGEEAVPGADYENTALLLIWGHNPYTSIRCNVRDILMAKKRGAKLVVIDPRKTEIAKKADLWLQVRPGTDGALILGLIHFLIKEKLYDEPFVRDWTNAPFLVKTDTGDLLKPKEIGVESAHGGYLVWNKKGNGPAVYRPDLVGYEKEVDPEIRGTFTVRLSKGEQVDVRPAFEELWGLAAPYHPEHVEFITGVPSREIEELAGYLGTIKPVSYYSYNGLEQHTNAMQTNRALCILYALAGSLDKPGGNVYFPSIPGPRGKDSRLLPLEIHRKRLGYEKRPLGPAGIPNSSVQAYEVFDSLLTGIPYRIKAMLAFGGNILTANSHSLIGREALTHLDFYVQTDLFMTPSAEFADIVLPASTFYESFHVRLGFPNLLSSRRWVQYRPRVIPLQFESRSDMEIIFDLACRLGLGDRFWNGNLEEAFNALLKPLGLDMEELKRRHGGCSIDLPLQYRKYSLKDPGNGIPRGFKTPSKRIEIYSQLFKTYGYDPLPVYKEPSLSPVSRPDLSKEYPLILTCSKLLEFCHGQHRSLPSLRKKVPHPFVEIHPETARKLGIADGEWVFVETPQGKIKVKAKWTEEIGLDVVCVQHGWWESCPELDLPGYDPFTSEGANANLLYSTRYIDEISGSVPYKAYLCKVTKLIDHPMTGTKFIRKNETAT
jgi:anaerobic selenocysteine-containing dehydrogenase